MTLITGILAFAIIVAIGIFVAETIKADGVRFPRQLPARQPPQFRQRRKKRHQPNQAKNAILPVGEKI